MKRRINIFYVLTVLILLSVTLLSIVNYYKVNKIIVIDVIKVVNEFKLRKDLENKAEPKLLFLKNKVDSLAAILDFAIKNNKTDIESLNKEYYFWKEKANEAYQTSNNSINEETWNRLNPLIDEFGIKNDYRIMIGANGMGTVLYNKDAVDKTNELINFINQKYQKGGN